jgi:hypothetical protein
MSPASIFWAVAHDDVSTHGQAVALQLLLAFGVHDLDRRVLTLVAALDDHLLGEAGLFVDLLAVGGVLLDALELDLTGQFGDDHRVVRIPGADQVVLLRSAGPPFT